MSAEFAASLPWGELILDEAKKEAEKIDDESKRRAFCFIEYKKMWFVVMGTQLVDSMYASIWGVIFKSCIFFRSNELSSFEKKSKELLTSKCFDFLVEHDIFYFECVRLMQSPPMSSYSFELTPRIVPAIARGITEDELLNWPDRELQDVTISFDTPMPTNGTGKMYLRVDAKLK